MIDNLPITFLWAILILVTAEHTNRLAILGGFQEHPVAGSLLLVKGLGGGAEVFAIALKVTTSRSSKYKFMPIVDILSVASREGY